MLSNVAKGVRNFSSVSAPREVVIVSATRTPIGSIQGSLSPFTASQLGGMAIRSAVDKAGISASDVQEVIMGNVIQSGQGQAPARQAALAAGLPNSVICTTINKMCASGTKAVMWGAQSIALGIHETIVAGGMESMTNAPHLIAKARQGYRYGNGVLEDSLVRDGLTDAYNRKPMGWCAEETAKKYGLTRKDQDDFALESYRRAAEATKTGAFSWEITPVSITKGKETKIFNEDEEFKNLKADKVPTLKPAFTDDVNGTVTAANSSKLSDGGAALVLMSAEKAKRAGLKPLARIIGFGDAAHAPADFPTAPALAMPRALQSARITPSQVEYYEINEAFAAVTLVNAKILNLDLARVNVNGGAVALGHPIGCSGARIIVSLLNILRNKNATIGVAGICNGGGGASTVVIERLN